MTDEVKFNADEWNAKCEAVKSAASLEVLKETIESFAVDGKINSEGTMDGKIASESVENIIKEMDTTILRLSGEAGDRKNWNVRALIDRTPQWYGIQDRFVKLLVEKGLATEEEIRG